MWIYTDGISVDGCPLVAIGKMLDHFVGLRVSVCDPFRFQRHLEILLMRGRGSATVLRGPLAASFMNRRHISKLTLRPNILASGRSWLFVLDDLF